MFTKRAIVATTGFCLVYGGLMFMTYLGFSAVPIGFIPEQDKGYLVLNAQLPDGASLERSEAVVAKMTEIAAAGPTRCTGSAPPCLPTPRSRATRRGATRVPAR